MSLFIDSLLARHTLSGNTVQPRLRGRFEPESLTPVFATGYGPTNQELRPQRDPSLFFNQPDRAENRPPDEGYFSEKAEPILASPPPFRVAVSVSPQSSETEDRFDLWPNRPDDSPPTHSWPQSEMTNANLTHQPNTGKMESVHPQTDKKTRGSSPGQADMAAIVLPDERPLVSPKTEQPAHWPPTPGQPAAEPTHAPRQQQVSAPDILSVMPRNTFERQRPLYLTPAQSLPTIRVTIGRIDVRAVQQTASPSASRSAATPKPALSLDAYLKQQNQRDS